MDLKFDFQILNQATTSASGCVIPYEYCTFKLIHFNLNVRGDLVIYDIEVTSKLQIRLLAAVESKLLKTFALTNDTNGCPIFNTEPLNLFKDKFILKEL